MSREGFTMRNLIVCTVHPILVGVIKSRRFGWAGHVARMEEIRRTFKIVTGKPIGSNYLKEIGINKRNWVDSAQDRDYWRAWIA